MTNDEQIYEMLLTAYRTQSPEKINTMFTQLRNDISEHLATIWDDVCQNELNRLRKV